jgi:hypothetical protein
MRVQQSALFVVEFFQTRTERLFAGLELFGCPLRLFRHG